MIFLLEGPAGSGKSQLARDMIEAGEAQVLADLTSLWAAVGNYQRGPDGKYPERDSQDPALSIALRLQAAAARMAAEDNANVVVTTSRPDQAERWQQVADSTGDELTVRTIDPGRDVVVKRLSDARGNLSPSCANAIARWYGQ